ncbi:MAG: sigma-70 family RNA polymerase sigma factor, partial [Pseudomonadota bacterium]
TFLFRIAHNHCINHIVRRRPAESLQQLELDPMDDARPIDALVGAAQESTQLLSAVRRLPLIQREVVVLALEDMDYGEIAAVLGITETNVGVRLNRARASLRKLMGENT